MKFYLNETALIGASENQEFRDCILELYEFFELGEEANCQIYLNPSFFQGEVYAQLCSNHDMEYVGFMMYLSQLPLLNDSEDLEKLEITVEPLVHFEPAIEIFKYCFKDLQKEILTSCSDRVVTQSHYQLCGKSRLLEVENIIGLKGFQHYLVHNPTCNSIEDVFIRVEEKCPHITFTSKALRTAKKREEIYRSYGYEKIIDLFLKVEEILYPYFHDDLDGMDQKKMEKLFLEEAGIEYSQDGGTTLKQFKKERELEINGVKERLSHHLKPGDNRIYLHYSRENDTIYVGHAGKHPRSRKNKKIN